MERRDIMRKENRKMRLAVLMLALCLSLLCGATPVSAASGKPARVKITSVSRKKGGRAQVKYKRVPKANGYQIMFATNKKFTSGKIVVNVKKGKATSKTVKGIKTWKKYYVRVRAYRSSGRRKLYGKWSKPRILKPGTGVSADTADRDDRFQERTDDPGNEDVYEDSENGNEAERDPEEETEPKQSYQPETGEREPEFSEAEIEPTVWGFFVHLLTTDMLYKAEMNGAHASRTNDGGHVYHVAFSCDGGENWLKDVEFEVEDVTPSAYKKMYAAMGVPGGVTAKSTKINTQWGVQNYGNGAVVDTTPRVLEPLDDSPYTQPVDMKYALSEINLTVQARMATRVIKVTAKKDGKALDTVYLTASGDNPQNENEYARQDLELYAAVRRKVESKLWKPGMSNLEKLQALQEYINTTSHYPREAITSKKYNPAFWEEWSVDGLELYDDLAGDTILSKTMALQGGTTTCQAATILLRAATEDLGLSGIANKDKETAGEGVWVGMGSASTNPGNPAHETFYYQDATGKKYALDAQGMGYPGTSGALRCEAHRCKDKIIPLG